MNKQKQYFIKKHNNLIFLGLLFYFIGFCCSALIYNVSITIHLLGKSSFTILIGELVVNLAISGIFLYIIIRRYMPVFAARKNNYLITPGMVKQIMHILIYIICIRAIFLIIGATSKTSLFVAFQGLYQFKDLTLTIAGYSYIASIIFRLLALALVIIYYEKLKLHNLHDERIFQAFHHSEELLSNEQRKAKDKKETTTVNNTKNSQPAAHKNTEPQNDKEEKPLDGNKNTKN